MLTRNICCIAILLICRPATLLAQDTLQQNQKDIIEELKTKFPENSELAIGIIHHDTIRFVGYRREGKNWRSLDNRNSVFEVGSITKIFTSTLLANSILQGIVKADEPITSNLSIEINGAEAGGRPITYQSLANHTSGLPRLPPRLRRSMIFNTLLAATVWPFSKKTGNPYAGYDQRKLTKYLKSGIEPKSVPGEVFRYSNLGAALLGFLLVKKYEKSYEYLLQSQIFQHYKMSSSTTVRESVAARLVSGRNSNGNRVKNWDLGAMEAAGAALSTVHDLSIFALANFLPDSVLSFQRQKTLTIDQDLDIALGWFIKKYKNGKQYYWHNGATGGYTSSMTMDVKSKSSVIILTNVGGKKTVDTLCFRLMETLSDN